MCPNQLPDQGDSRWELMLRRVRPGDGDWPWRWRVEVRDAHHWDPCRGGNVRRRNIAFTEAGARRWAQRYIGKIERSDASERRISVSVALDERQQS